MRNKSKVKCVACGADTVVRKKILKAEEWGFKTDRELEFYYCVRCGMGWFSPEELDEIFKEEKERK